MMELILMLGMLTGAPAEVQTSGVEGCVWPKCGQPVEACVWPKCTTASEEVFSNGAEPCVWPKCG